MLWFELILIVVLHLCRTILFSGDKKAETIPVQRSAERVPPDGRDILWMAGICIFYGLIAFYHPGVRQNPVTEYEWAAGETMVMDMGEDGQAAVLNWYLKYSDRTVILAETGTQRDASGEIIWNEAQEIPLKYVFSWGKRKLNVPGRYLRLSGVTQDMTVAELVIQDESGNVSLPAEVLPALFDEQHLFPEQMDHQSSLYFDEVYHARTAYEYMEGLTAYENTHPPLGKILIAAGACLFGAAPFGFRFMGVLAGILMLPFVYLLARESGVSILNSSHKRDAAADLDKDCARVRAGSRRLGVFGSLLFAFDFMHFTQTRVATIDVYITFFTIVMFYFMYRYMQMNFYDTPLRRTFLPLGACGIAFGLGISCKWTGFYAGAGLAVLFFLTLYRRYREYRMAVQDPEGHSNGVSHASIRAKFRGYAAGTTGFCMIFFVLLPFIIYLLSYIPFCDGTDAGLLERMWENQKTMFRYHSGLRAEHAYASTWYEWPVMIRPVFYFSRTINETMKQGISAFGNPLVWWAGIPAFFYMMYRWLRRQDENARFLCIAYLACYVPWMLVERCTFMYHYFPCVPFVVCMIVYSFAQWRQRLGERRWTALMTGYGIGAILLFVMFYPVISGAPVSEQYVDQVLRWFPAWDLLH